MLYETPFGGVDDAFLAGCRRLREEGFGLVLAHPERAAGFLDGGLERLAGELAAGAVVQVSVDSLLGHHGRAALAGAASLLWRGVPAVVASDGHGGRRTQTQADGYARLLAAGLSEWRARDLAGGAPRRLLAGGVAAVASRCSPQASSPSSPKAMAATTA